MLRLDGLIKDFGGQRVLDGASLALKPGERAALVGANGTGKTTLLRIAAGVDDATGGTVERPRGGSVGYLPQNAMVQPGRSVREEALEGVADLLALEREMQAIHERIERGGLPPDELEALVHHQADCEQQFASRGGYSLEAELARVLDGLGFSEADRDRPTHEFSGGWQMRIALSRLLLAQPALLLLDEPTNHLDLAATEWLEGYVRSHRGSLLIVSHDRAFLDAVVTRVFELRGGRIETFVGNYTTYRAERQRRDEAQAALAGRQQEEIERVESYIRRYKEGNRATMAKSREKMLARLQAERVANPQQDRNVRFRFPACPPGGREVISLSRVSQAYDGRVVFQDATLAIERGERVALIGPNGAGKSTLLRLLAGSERPSSGHVTLGVAVRPAYFSQDLAQQLDPAATLLEELERAAPPAWDIASLRDLLGRFLFSGDDHYKVVRALSGGERSRLALARMLLRPTNLLLLDEPTNHLDVATREQLESTLSAFTGTLVFATHDRYLADRLATRVALVQDQRVRLYDGGYHAYRRAADAELTAARNAPSGPTPIRTVMAVDDPRSQQRRSAGEQRRLAAELRSAEQQVTLAEDRLRTIEAKLSDPGSVGGDLRALTQEHAEVAADVEALTARWEELMLALEGAA